ncbi:hypothetical protein EV198_2072 [Roseivirga ehrenbergii]|nr:hypothetical protein EV198_2072 [Roseivirga ehrenbergii]
MLLRLVNIGIENYFKKQKNRLSDIKGGRYFRGKGLILYLQYFFISISFSEDSDNENLAQASSILSNSTNTKPQ